jgi:argininosuccinate synthase
VSAAGTASAGYLPVKLSCQGATCSGTAEVTGRVGVKTHKGNQTVWKKETAVLAKAPYSIKMDQTATVELKLTSPGSTLFTHAKAHPVSEKGCVTVRGGSATTRTIRVL